MMEAVIFDMDGVIFDSERACLFCWSDLAGKWGLKDIETVFRRCIGTNKNQTRMILTEAYAGEFGEDIADRLMAESSVLFHARYDDNGLPMKDGVREILDGLKERGVPLGLASSTRKAAVEEELRAAGLLSYFDRIIGGDAVTISKPDPEIYLLACREMNVTPANTIAIEDSYNGIRSAHAAGMRPIMVPDLIPADDEMKRLSEAVFKDLSEVKEYLHFIDFQPSRG
ncbi:MAG: HAD family phosphatase [Lachnospiraceae bacterium]|nr:HAD family phosphatase [Lachnospiraceae bacterium]